VFAKHVTPLIQHAMNQKLIEKYLKGETSAFENDQILEWIEASHENRKLFMQQRRIYDAIIWHDNNTNSHQTFIYTKRNRMKSIVVRWMQIAAVIALIIAGTWFMKQQSSNSSDVLFTQSIEVPLGQRVNLTLSDGTKVSLNSNSKLHFPSTFSGDKRVVVLDGKGYFEVKHQDDKPFFVITEKYDIKVLGTTFNVLAYNNSDIFETSLLEGLVSIKDKNSKNSTYLQSNNKVTLKTDKLITTQLESEDDFLWRIGIYVFKNESLVDVFKKLEQYYQVQIQVKNKQVASHMCTGKFSQKEGIEHIIKVLQKASGFQYKRDEERNIITIL